jgi:large subunit ribosomal protein L14
MLLERSIVQVADNSGARSVRLFSVSGQNGRQSVGVGCIVKGAVQTATPNGKVKRRAKVSVLIVRTKNRVNRKDGSAIAFNDNACVVLNANREPVGTRVFGPIAREIRELGHSKLISLAEEVL